LDGVDEIIKLARDDLGRGPGRRGGGLFLRALGPGGPAPQHAEGGVVRNRVKPGAQRSNL
jgi:hypothetical protein